MLFYYFFIKMTLLLIYFVKSRLDACFLTVGMGHDVCIYDPG